MQREELSGEEESGRGDEASDRELGVRGNTDRTVSNSFTKMFFFGFFQIC